MDRVIPMFQRLYKPLSEFPKYEINLDGEIRNIETRIQRPTHTNGWGLEVVKFTKDGKRSIRSVEKLRKEAFAKP